MSELHEKLESIDRKLDRLLDPESGVHARIAAHGARLDKHEADDRWKHRLIVALLVASALGGAGAAKALVELIAG